MWMNEKNTNLCEDDDRYSVEDGSDVVVVVVVSIA